MCEQNKNVLAKNKSKRERERDGGCLVIGGIGVGSCDSYVRGPMKTILL